MKPKYLHAAIVVLSLLIVGTQPALGTKYIPSDTSIGNWDPVDRIYTLTTDVSETIHTAIVIEEDNLTLDGAGHTVTGPGTGSGSGVYLPYRTGVNIQNLNVQGFVNGIYLYYSNSIILTGNTAQSNTHHGIYLNNSNSNTLTGNTASNYHAAPNAGIYLFYSSDNDLSGNIAHSNYTGINLHDCTTNTLTANTVYLNNYAGISLFKSTDNTVTENAASNNHQGIVVGTSRNNTLTNNTASNNSYLGILLYESVNNTLSDNTTSNNNYGICLNHHCSNNTLTGNTVNANTTHGIAISPYCSNNILTDNMVSNNGSGIMLWASDDNQIYTNNLIDNIIQASVGGSSGNIFNLSMSEGCGNYWSDWMSPDADGDGIVDIPYVFSGGQDNLPWVAQDGWLEPGWSPPGADVIVQPLDETTGETLATLSFDNITEGGMTTVTSMTPSENQGPPQGFRFGVPPVIIDISTTATFTGEIAICFDYSGMSFGNESTLKLFHRSDGSNWIDITTSVDTENDIICGVVESFSFFGVFETADPVVLLEELAQQVTALNLQQGIDNSLDAKLDAALSALDDVNANNNVAAVNTMQAFINAVEAQRGNQIPESDADDPIAAANEIITLLSDL